MNNFQGNHPFHNMGSCTWKKL